MGTEYRREPQTDPRGVVSRGILCGNDVERLKWRGNEVLGIKQQSHSQHKHPATRKEKREMPLGKKNHARNNTVKNLLPTLLRPHQPTTFNKTDNPSSKTEPAHQKKKKKKKSNAEPRARKLAF